MANTWHHDEKRFHPWTNPRALDAVLTATRKRWRRDGSNRIHFAYRNYASPGPSLWRNLQMERPLRREFKELERRCTQGDLEQLWPHPRKPTLYYY